MKGFMVCMMMILFTRPLISQSERSLVSHGNDLYEKEHYDEAEIQYRKAIKENEGSVTGRFNLGDALHKQQKFDQSAREFDSVAETAADPPTRRDAFFNRGNSFLEASQYDNAIASYVAALKLDPLDQDAKYNLSYALRKQQQEQENQQGKNGQQNKDQKNKQNENKDKQQQQQQQKNDQKNDQQNQPRNQSEQQKSPEQQAKQDHQMSRADAERILEVLKNSEKQVQKGLRAKVKQRAKSEKDW